MRWAADLVRKALTWVTTVAFARPSQPPKIVYRRETVCIWCAAVTSEGEPHEENCGL